MVPGHSNAHPASVPETSSEVQRLQALVAQLKSQLVQVAGPTPVTVDIPSERFRAFLCRGDAAVGLSTRPQAATMAGRPEEVGRISQLIVRGAQEWHGVQSEQNAVGSAPCMLPSTVGLMVR